MKKFLLTAILIVALSLTGCGGGPIISAESGAVPYSEMPSVPPEIEIPDTSVYTSGAEKIVCEFAFAPKGAETIKTALEGKTPDKFVAGYSNGMNSGYSYSEIDFLGSKGFIINGTLSQDTDYGKTGDNAAFAVAPYGDYFVMIHAAGADASIAEKVKSYLADFGIDASKIPVVQSSEAESQAEESSAASQA